MFTPSFLTKFTTISTVHSLVGVQFLEIGGNSFYYIVQGCLVSIYFFILFFQG